MTNEEIEKYHLLTEPIIYDKEKFENPNVVPAKISTKFNDLVIGNENADKVIIYLQGGPVLDFSIDEMREVLVKNTDIDLENVFLVNLKQEQVEKK
jgi:hypothetical protein